jgi:large subunit ribosomal protein L23
MKPAECIVDHILVTEKGTRMREENKYQFQVRPDANKPDIKRAVETLFGVHVTNVHTMNRMGKWKRGRSTRPGKTADWKRAIVTLKSGDSIDLT